MCGNRDHRKSWIDTPDLRDHARTPAPRHVDIGHHQRGAPRARLRDAGTAFRRHGHTVARGEQPVGEQVAKDGVVLDDENLLIFLHGRMMYAAAAASFQLKQWNGGADMLNAMRVDIDVNAQAPDYQAIEPHVLAVDDDPMTRELITDYLVRHDFRVTAVADGRAMDEVLATEVVDLIVLDLKLRGEDGMHLARKLRDESTIPIIMLTGRSDEADRVMGLELGADDYVTKPFSPREFLARIRTVLRRRRAEVRQGRPEGIRAYRFDGWELNLNAHRLTAPDGTITVLSKGEFSLLVVLLGAPHRILNRDQLLDLSRLHNDEVYNRAIDIQIMRLRRKIEADPAKPKYILTERGNGYVFSVNVETVY